MIVKRKLEKYALNFVTEYTYVLSYAQVKYVRNVRCDSASIFKFFTLKILKDTYFHMDEGMLI